MVSRQCKVEFKIVVIRMKFYVMSYPWLFVTLCWGDLSNMTRISYMMEGIILIPLRKMGVNI
jgi:hypothetical protein